MGFLTGKTAIITGGGYSVLSDGRCGSIGYGIATAYAKDGANLVITGRNIPKLEKAKEELEKLYGIKVLALQADISAGADNEATANMVIATAVEAFGRIDVLINNAGMLLFNQLERTDSARIDTIIALHCTTPTKLCRMFAPAMRARGGGHIVLMSSVTAWTPFPTISHYAATKAYLRSFGQSLWYELREAGVTVTTVYPSAVDTPFYTLGDGARRWLRRLGVMLSAEEVARKALRAMRHGHRRCLPGLLTKVEAAICAILPAWALLPVLRIPAVRRILDRV